MKSKLVEGIDDFEMVEGTIPAELDQGHGMLLGNRIRLCPLEMTVLKTVIDEEINKSCTNPPLKFICDVNAAKVPRLKIDPNNSKLKKIPVSIEFIDEQILLKIGPCDLSGVGGHTVRAAIIKNLVDQVLLVTKNQHHNFKTVNVSACIGMRGRTQWLGGIFSNSANAPGNHMCAYIKTAGETGLTYWDPRNGPQKLFDDTICAMVCSVTTSLFENGIRESSIASSAHATQKILKHPQLEVIFDNLLNQTQDRIVHLVSGVKKMAEHSELKEDDFVLM